MHIYNVIYIYTAIHAFSNDKNIWRYALPNIPFRVSQTSQEYVISFHFPKHTV